MVKNTRKHIAYNYLYNAIVTCQLPPGTAIVEQEISDLLGISRTPVREALKQLEIEGLVRHVPLRGTFVAEISTQDVEEIFALRQALELLALRTAINEITEQELNEIESYLEGLGPESSPESFYRSDRKLHDLIVKYGRNRRLRTFYDMLNAQIERVRRVSAQKPDRLKKSRQEHLEIVRALKERNLQKAEAFLTQHLKNVKESFIEVCRSIE